MKLSGRNIRRIYSDSFLSFDVDMEITTLTGSASFGVSGMAGANPRSTLFTFKSGRVFDPEGNNVYSYQRNSPIDLKGTFGPTTYDYFIDNNLISSLGTKDEYTIENIFFESKGCEIELNDLNFYGKTGTLDLSKTMTFGANISSDSIGSAGNIGHGNVGDSSNVYAGTSKSGDYLTFPNAITFNRQLPIVGDIISGEVTLGSEFFEFDNRESNLKSLSGVVGNVGNGTNIKNLSLRANTDLTDGAYPVEINFYTTFGNITRNATIIGGSFDNISGVKVGILGDGFPLQSGQNTTHSLGSQNGELVSGKFAVAYSVDTPEGIDSTDGIPYKIYLEHVEGDHDKNYSFITGVQLSGSGKGYSVAGDLTREVTFRVGDLGSATASATDGATFGTQLEEKATGLINESATFSTMLTEANIDSIRTNLYVGSNGQVGGYEENIQKMQDGTLMTQHTNVKDIVTVFGTSSSDSVTEKPSGVAKVYSYKKPVTDWKLFTGVYGHDTSTYLEHTQTGISDTPLKRHKGSQEVFLGVVLQAKNYLDTDPMVYNIAFSGADGYGDKVRVTGTVMETDYNPPLVIL